MDIHQILKMLPHRYPFLLVDRVLQLDKGKSIVALKNVTINEPFFVGHFPHHPGHRFRIVFVDAGKLFFHGAHRRFHARVLGGIARACARRGRSRLVAFPALGHCERGDQLAQFEFRIVGALRHRLTLRERFRVKLVDRVVVLTVILVDRHRRSAN